MWHAVPVLALCSGDAPGPIVSLLQNGTEHWKAARSAKRCWIGLGKSASLEDMVVDTIQSAGPELAALHDSHAVPRKDLNLKGIE